MLDDGEMVVFMESLTCGMIPKMVILSVDVIGRLNAERVLAVGRISQPKRVKPMEGALYVVFINVG